MPRPIDATVRPRVLDTARRLFYAHGIQAVGMAQLVEESGCGKSALYREFPTKDALVLAYLQQFADTRAEREQTAVAAADGPRDQLRALVGVLVETSARPDFRGCPFRNYLREFPGSSSPAGEFAADWLAGARRQVHDLVVTTGVEHPEVVADQIWLAVDGLWASAPYADRSRLGAAALDLVDRLVPA